MAENLTEEQLVGYKIAFDQFDTDGNGTLSLAELHKAIVALGHGVTEEEVRRLFVEVDKDKSGTIDFAEFLAVIARKLIRSDNEEEIIEAFRIFDKDHSGSLSVKEFTQVLGSIGEKLSKEEIDEIIALADQNQDGEIDYREFTRLLLLR